MFRNRRFACLVLGMWLGVAGCVDLVGVRSSTGIEPFLSEPGGPVVKSELGRAGAGTIRHILGRYAEEENASLFEDWEWTQMLIATAFFLLIVLAERPPAEVLVLVPAMLAIVILQRFLTPHVATLARDVAEIPPMGIPNNQSIAQYRVFQRFYSGCEALKFLAGCGVGARLMIRLKPASRPAKDGQAEVVTAEATPEGTEPERRIRKRRRIIKRRSHHDG